MKVSRYDWPPASAGEKLSVRFGPLPLVATTAGPEYGWNDG